MPKQNWQGDNFEFRRKFQKVYVDKGSGDVVLRLHETDIVRVRANGDVILSTGGWPTHKTMSSMNDALELFGMYLDCSSGGIPQGRWQVTDSDGTIHAYENDKVHYMTTIRAKSADDRSRAQWLAEAYETPYNPPAAGPRVAAAAAPQGPRVATQSAAAPAAARANGLAAASSSAPPAVPGAGGSWANIAKRANPLTATSSGAPVRMTGPGAAAAGHGRVTGPGAAASSHVPSGPPGFGAGPSSSHAAAPAAHIPGAAGAAGLRGQHCATVTSAPPMPVDAQLVAHMAQLGIDQHELDDDAHLCVVCMEEPRSIVLVPCGHMALCKDCCQQIIVAQQAQCPMCCQDVEYHVEVDQ